MLSATSLVDYVVIICNVVFEQVLISAFLICHIVVDFDLDADNVKVE